LQSTALPLGHIAYKYNSLLTSLLYYKFSDKASTYLLYYYGASLVMHKQYQTQNFYLKDNQKYRSLIRIGLQT
jgi:hypothetical protein